MATTVSRSLEEINGKVTELNSNIKKLSNENKNLNKSLRLDPSSTTLLSQKISNLKQQISLSKQKTDELKRSLQLMQTNSSTEMTAAEFDKLKLKIAQAEAETKGFSAQLAKINQQKFDQVASSLSKISKVAVVALTALVGVETAYAKSGDEVAKATERFHIGAEEFQYMAHIFDKTTGNSQGYIQALQSVTSQLGSLEKGSAKAVKAFSMVGLTMNDVSGKSSAEVLEMIIEKLKLIEDEDKRVAVAQALLANSGTDVAMVSQLSNEEIQALNQTLEEQGLLTQEQANDAAALNDRIGDLQNAFKKMAAELGTALLPCMEVLIDVAKIVITAISSLSNVFNIFGETGKKVGAVLLLIIAIIPVLIKAIKGVQSVINIMQANPINVKIMLICTAVALLILLLVKLAQWLSKCFGHPWELDADTTALTDAAFKMNDDMTNAGINNSTTNTTNNSSVVNNYYDNSTVNVEANGIDDIDEIAESLSTKIKVGG